MKELTICWSITTRCNLSCSYCFSRYDNQLFYDTSERLIDVVFNKIKEASKKYSIRLVILGGEPTLHTKLIKICENALLICRKVIVVTNGLLLNVIDTLPREVSIDLSYHSEDVNVFYNMMNSIRKNHYLQVLFPLYKIDVNNILTLITLCKRDNIRY